MDRNGRQRHGKHHRFGGAILKRGLVLVALLATLTAGCEDTPDDRGIGSSGNGGGGGYRIESEPTLTADGRWVYLIATDTAHLDNSGIQRTLVERPQREWVLIGDGYRSPTVSTNDSLLAYLSTGTLCYYRFRDGARWNSNVFAPYASVLFVNDHELIGQVGDSLYLIDESQATRTALVRGQDPTLIGQDAFVYCVRRDIGYAYAIATYDLREGLCDTIFHVSTLDNPGQVRWPSYDPGSGRLAWLLQGWGTNTVNSCHIDSAEFRHYIDTTSTFKPYLINSNAIIYTGPDGRFRKSDYIGYYKTVFWYAVPP